jgi:signal transduction histidine kinase/CheY-like chemotaxis protein/ABC-type amino acid transport substrate-binding protein
MPVHAPAQSALMRCLLAGALLLLALGRLDAAPARRVRVGIFPNPPATFMDANGQAQGFLVDILREEATREHWELEFVPGTWFDCLDRTRAGDLDLLPSVAHTPERDAYLDFGQVPSFTMWSILYAHPGARIHSILDVRGRKVGIMLGDVNGEHFKQLCAKFNIPCEFEEFGNQSDVLAAVASGRTDAGVTANTFGYAHESEYRVERTSVVFNPFDIFYGTAKGRNDDLLAALDRYLAAGRKDPDSSYHHILNRWLNPVRGRSMPPWVYRTGVATLALLLVAVGTVLVFRRRVLAATEEVRSLAAGLERELDSRRLLEERILRVAEGVGVSTGGSFLQDLMRHLALASEADIAFVGERIGREGGDFIRTLATFQDGRDAENLEWPVPGSVSEQVLKEDICVFPSGVQEAFPGDPGLRQTGLQSYVGVALRDSSGRVLGLIGICNRHPLSNPTLVASLLRIFSARASAELERQNAEQERLELERQVQHAQKLESLGVLAGGIAHDFNNLLTAMLGHMNVAQLKLAPESPAIPHLESLERIIHRASDLTRQMLAYSGKGRFVVRPYDLNQVVREMTHLLEVSISKKIALRFHLAESLPPVQADAAQIQQVIMNLVTNASDAIGDREGTIRLATSLAELDRRYLDQLYQGQDLAPGSYVALEVSDTGCGMSQEVQGRIFEPFFTTKVTGRGLGLSATLGILKGHHAGIRIYSEAGRGTTFRLLFPACPTCSGEAPPQEAARTPRQIGTVLLVDDEQMIREAAGAALESLGLQVVTAVDGLDAVEVFTRQKDSIDLVLMDLTMPHMDGREAFQHLRRIRPDIPVILSSGYNEQESIQQFLGRGLAGFLQKPYTLQALERTVQEALARRGD